MCHSSAPEVKKWVVECFSPTNFHSFVAHFHHNTTLCSSLSPEFCASFALPLFHTAYDNEFHFLTKCLMLLYVVKGCHNAFLLKGFPLTPLFSHHTCILRENLLLEGAVTPLYYLYMLLHMPNEKQLLDS